MRKIREVLELGRVRGDVGIEIEVEAEEPLPSVSGVWRYEEDGSLRGNSMEYITNGPIALGDVGQSLQLLHKQISPHGILNSFRAGVHIHVNVQELTLPQLGNFAAIYYCLETALTKFCGDMREGNHFCLRLRDAEYPLHMLVSSLSNSNLFHLGTDNLRYAAMNLRSITRYGSLEFRAMETQPDFDKIEDWCNILCRIRDYAVQMTDRSNIAYQISADGPENWARAIIGEDLFPRINHTNFERDVMHDMRIAQPLIYLREN